MQHASQLRDVYLQPGDYHFGDRHTQIRTLLGSCVAITMWHPLLRIGGMCHFMLPARAKGEGGVLDGRFADEALALFMQDIRRAGTRPEEYEVKLFGGGNMFPGQIPGRTRHIGAQNGETAKRLIREHGFSCRVENLGGVGHRNLRFDVQSGDVWMRHTRPVGAAPCDNCRMSCQCVR
jgi:chemotaxis protein CheD